MAIMNRCEAEVDAIRDILHEKTKHMTASEHTRWTNERGLQLAAQYGFKIGKPTSATKASNAPLVKADTGRR